MGAGYSMKARAEEAEVFIYEDIGESWFGGVSAKQFTTDLKALGVGVKTINLHLNCYGGEVFDAVAIYRQLVDHPARVVTHIDGVAASSGATIAMAGDEIRITEAGFLMIHNASGGMFGEAKEMRQLADLLDTISATIGDVYAGRTGNTAEQIAAWMGATTWMTAAEAVERKFADQVVENLRVAASGDPKALYANAAKPKLRRASEILSAANEAMGLGPAAPLNTPNKSNDPLRARIQLQAARLAAARTPQSAA
jgi:ATP-dependent Clp protease protease subunit